MSDILPPHPSPRRKSKLIGCWFHTFNPGTEEIRWQGKVLSEEQDGFFLVQLYEWILGAESTRKLVHFRTMVDWEFYSCSEDMQAAWKDYDIHRQMRERAAKA